MKGVSVINVQCSCDQIVDPVDNFDKLMLPPASHVYDNWTDWESWEASSEISKLLPYYRSGYDNDGLVG